MELVHVPGGLVDDVVEASLSHLGPEGRLVFDPRNQVVGRGLGALEHAAVAVLPNHPRGQQGHGGEAFAHGLRHTPLGAMPPGKKGNLMAGGGARQAEPGDDVLPYLPGEGAAEEQVVHCLGVLAAQDARVVVLQPMTS